MQLKTEPEDFVVEEVPLYLPSGDGPHLYLWIEKRGIGTEAAVLLIAQGLGVPPMDIGYAGMKDAQAITRQWISIPAAAEPQLGVVAVLGLGDATLKILSTARHRNKLRTGHLRGNRFRIRVREVTDAELERLPHRLAQLRCLGMWNAFGAQRFGVRGDNAEAGLAVLQGRRHRSGRLLRLELSALQSLVFNRYLALRRRIGAFPVLGDVLQVVRSGGLFLCEDAVHDAERIAAGEICVTGPMPGPKCFRAGGQAAAWEDAVLSELGLLDAPWERFARLCSGTRRPLRIPVSELRVTPAEAGCVWVECMLPAGSYATVLIEHLFYEEALSFA